MLFEKLSKQDRYLINSYIDEYGANPDTTVYRAPADLEYRLRHWDMAKEELYQLFGGQLILEKQVSYMVPEAKLRGQIYDSINYGKMKDFMNSFDQKMRSLFDLDWMSDLNWPYRVLTSGDSLAANEMRGHFDETYVFEFSDGKKIKVEKSSKPMRVLGKMAKLLGLQESFEEFRLEHSRILNQKKLQGTLCLSIHPMDYLTMSDNASKWTSCMSWRDTGGYRAGTVEMLNSPVVVVGYLKSDNNTYYDWNDKHWRSLFIVGRDIITSVKGYPYSCNELARICIDWLSSLARDNWNLEFNDTAEIQEREKFQYVDGHWYYLETETEQMYNDFGSDIHYGALPKIEREPSSQADPYTLTMYYSGHNTCMCCGERLQDCGGNYDESFVYCCNCSSTQDDTYECEECGCHYYYEDMYDVQGCMICPDCIDSVAARCVLDGDWYFLEDLTKVYIARVDDKPSEGIDTYSYMRTRFMDSEFNTLAYWNDHTSLLHPRRTENGIYYFNREDLTRRGRREWFSLFSDYYFTGKD